MKAEPVSEKAREYPQKNHCASEGSDVESAKEWKSTRFRGRDRTPEEDGEERERTWKETTARPAMER